MNVWQRPKKRWKKIPKRSQSPEQRKQRNEGSPGTGPQDEGLWETEKLPGTEESPGEPFGFRGFQDGDYLLSHLRSTIGVAKLNFSVRNGKRWNLRAIVT